MKHIIKDSRGRNAHSSQIKILLGLDQKAKLPKEGMPVREIQGIKVFVAPLDPARSRRRLHRVRAICPACGMEMSAGRLHQHVCN